MMNSSASTKLKLEDYLRLQYPITLCPEEEGGYTAIIPDLKGCMTQGETIEEALVNIEEAKQSWLETAFEFGDDIPTPSPKSLWLS